MYQKTKHNTDGAMKSRPDVDRLDATAADIRALIEDRRRKSQRGGYIPQTARVDVETLERWAREIEER